MQLVKEITTKTYRYDKQGVSSALVEEEEQYYYRNEEEKLGHAVQMKNEGFKDSGQVKENIGTVMNPELIWFGSYYRFKVIDEKEYGIWMNIK